MSGDLLSSTVGEFASVVGGLAGVEAFAGFRKRAGGKEREAKGEREGMERVLGVRRGDLEYLERKVKVMEEKVELLEEREDSISGSMSEVPPPNIQELYDAVKQCESSLSALQSEIDSSPDILSAKEALSDSASRANEAITKFRVSSSTLASLSKRSSMSSSSSDICPTCGQGVEGEVKERVLELARREEEEAEVLKEKVQELEAEVERLEREGRALEGELEGIMETWEGKRGKGEGGRGANDRILHSTTTNNLLLVASLVAAMEDLRMAREAYEFSLDEESRLKTKLSKKAEQEKELEFLNRTLSSDRVKVQELESEVENLMSSVAKCVGKEAKWGWCEKLFGPRGIQAYVLTSALNELNYLTSNYLSSLSEDTLRLKLTMGETGVISRSVKALEKTVWGKRTLATLSGGQWRR